MFVDVKAILEHIINTKDGCSGEGHSGCPELLGYISCTNCMVSDRYNRALKVYDKRYGYIKMLKKYYDL